MWSLITVGWLIFGLHSPVQVQGWVPSIVITKINRYSNLLRGRVLASSIKKGMTRDEVHDILGLTLKCGTGAGGIWYSEEYGVIVEYRRQHFKVAGEKLEDSRHVVDSVHPASLPDFFPFLRAWPKRTDP